jgi:transposase-like protein
VDGPLSGEVEVDETYVGGKRKGRVGRPSGDDPQKTPVVGMVERGGKLVARVVPDTGALTLMGLVQQHVLPGSMIYTDEYQPYLTLARRGYNHRRVHHRQKVYVAADGTSTNSIEGFFGLLKNGIRGVYHSVSKQHLQSYLDEYAFRYNRRDEPTPMFWAILDRVEKASPAPAPALPAA